MRKHQRIKTAITVFCIFFLLIGVVCLYAANWYVRIYGNLGFDAILYTLLSDLSNVESNLISSFINLALIPAVIVVILIASILFLKPKKKIMLQIREKVKIRLYPFPRVLSVLLSLILSVSTLYSAAANVELLDFIKYVTQTTSIYDENYVDPLEAEIIFPEKKQNLIYLYLESMETSFLSKEMGGGNDITPIPELYDLAQKHVNFSNNDGVGGYFATWCSTWTIAAMVAHTSGVPLKSPPGMGANDYGQDTFLPGLNTLSDVLHENGYYQALMVGSDAAFGGRKQYYEQHGTDKIYDLYTARADGIVPQDYNVWWGMEDIHLFEYAKQELGKLAAQDQPFALTILTVDTHHMDGYVCDYCQNEYPVQYENVLACSSRQVLNFVNWLQEQDFYENTTIIISGDHPTMDNVFIETNIDPEYDRRIYNCFINAQAYTDNTKNRESCSLDMFPTTLAAMGCKIEGDRLGLGTDLFSDTPTYCEEMGTEEFNNVISMSSTYYTENFYFPKD